MEGGGGGKGVGLGWVGWDGRRARLSVIFHDDYDYSNGSNDKYDDDDNVDGDGDTGTDRNMRVHKSIVSTDSCQRQITPTSPLTKEQDNARNTQQCTD